jgi:uncharacterized membrane protein
MVLLALVMLQLASALTPTPVAAQNLNPFNIRDNEYRLLGLKRAKEAYELSRRELDRQQQLFDRDMITALDLDRARSVHADAEVNYQQSLLAVLFEEQYVSVSEAVKYRASNGAKRVRITLVNTSGGTAEYHQLLNLEDEVFRSLQPDVIHNVYVSMLNDDNAIVSTPYEAKITELRFGEPRTIDFGLLQDLDAVTILLYYANGSQRTMKIFLQKDASENRVAVQSEQFSQEVELGQSASFDLTLELYSGVSNTFKLAVVNLPDAISRYFSNASGGVRLSQVKFTESGRTKRAALEVTLPDRPTEDVVMDRSIPFYVLVVPRHKIDQLGDLESKQWTEAELEQLDVGFVRLELRPRGRGEILVQSPQLYYSVQTGESVTMTLNVLNEGSNRLDNIEVRTDLPLNWTKTVDPLVIASLGIREEAIVTLSFTPPPDVTPGKYEVRLRTSGTTESQPVTSPDKTVTIEIRPQANVVGTVALVIVIVGLVGGIVIFGVRLSRR